MVTLFPLGVVLATPAAVGSAPSSTQPTCGSIVCVAAEAGRLPQIRFHDLRHTCTTLLLTRNVVFSYRHRGGLGGEWEDVKEPISLWTPCNFGGERPWFICP